MTVVALEIHRSIRWNSPTDYARDLLDDLGVMDAIERNVPEWIKPSVGIEWEALGRDLAYDHYVVEGDGVWVWESS